MSKGHPEFLVTGYLLATLMRYIANNGGSIFLLRNLIDGAVDLAWDKEPVGRLPPEDKRELLLQNYYAMAKMAFAEPDGQMPKVWS